jgi:hypothetical protein
MGFFGKSRAEKEAEARKKAGAGAPRHVAPTTPAFYHKYYNECNRCRCKQWNVWVFECLYCGGQFCAICQKDVGSMNESYCPYRLCKAKGKPIGIIQPRDG